MKLDVKTPKKVLSKAFLKQRILRSEIDYFKENLRRLLNNIDEIEYEENQKNHIRDFLRETYYKNEFEVNTKDRKDLVIHLGKTNNDNVGVIIEAKRPSNRAEMISPQQKNCKALHEIILYYFDERESKHNNELKHLIITNVYEWYIFDANVFDKYIYRNSQLKKLYQTYLNDKKDNSFFYDEASKILDEIPHNFECVYFDIRDYEDALKNEDLNDDKKLIALQKLLSPYFLLKQPFANDSNTLNQNFYKELLYILGLEEVKQSGKHIIRRREKNRQEGSFIENTINILEVKDKIEFWDDKDNYGETKDEQLFNVALELCLTWINRVLFLKLLEGLLLNYHSGNKDYSFLNIDKINDFDELFKLFHQVLAKNISERKEAINQKYANVPYLNSSLFEISDLENKAICINELDNSAPIKLFESSVLKRQYKNKNDLTPLDYLFAFLDAYDFSSEGGEDIVEDNKAIINASVLGKVFEKINGYKDGSFFTPSFITMYMSRKSLRMAVLKKFNDYFKQIGKAEVKNFDELYNALDRIDIQKANEIVDSLRVCDPAVGSGHFLVSALNEIIVIKSELGILTDKQGKLLRGYEITVENDELIVSDGENIFEYNYKNNESQRVQVAIFKEKQNVIENCLFGVDINPNSVKICRLRLWIELLKHSYYIEGTKDLETLPNIDINIKIGDSLISKYDLDSPLTQKDEITFREYKTAVQAYKEVTNRDDKKELKRLIEELKSKIEGFIHITSKKKSKYAEELNKLLSEIDVFETEKSKQKRLKRIEFLKQKIEKENEVEKENRSKFEEICKKNSIEWRFEFPEVLDDEGKFIGFDVIIGNPPYIQLQQDSGKLANQYKTFEYQTYSRMGDIYTLFYELGIKILKVDGILSFITSNKWMRAGYGKNLRKFFLMHKPLILIDLGPGIFESATVDSNIMILQKLEKVPDSIQLEAVSLPKEALENIEDYSQQNKVILKNLSGDAWFIGSEAEQRLKEKIERIGKPLKDWDVNIYRGVLTGLNEAFIIDTEKRNEILTNCKDEEERKRTEEIIKPILRGRDIKRYYYEWAGLWVINTHNGYKRKKFPSQRGVSAIADGVFEKYKSLPYNPKLKKRAQELRKAGNLSEVIFWNSVKKKQFLNLDFHRQKIIGNYIVDFYCPEISLVIEIDGYSHNNKGEYDEERDKYLKNLGLNIIHFSDNRIKNDFDNVLKELEKYCSELLSKNTPSLRDTPLKEGNYEEVEPVNVSDYPAIKEHLDKYWDKLNIRQDKGITPYNLRNCAYLDEFEKEKVVWTPVNSEYRFTILPSSIYFVNSVFMITGIKVKYFCGIFNSPAIKYFLRCLFSSEKEYTYASKENMEKIPLPPITEENREIVRQIEGLVDKIIRSKQEDKTAETSHWEREIDELVYKLYNLTEEEVGIVEGER